MFGTAKVRHREGRVSAGTLRRPAIEGGWLKRDEAIMGTAISVELWSDDRVQGEAAISAMGLGLAVRVSRLAEAYLRAGRATYCLSLHGKMPPIEAQLPILRALWPGPLVCRWNLHRRHGAYGYEEAKRLYGNFDRLVDPDPETRQALARTAAATASAGHAAYVTIGNKAEGSAPWSVLALAEAAAEYTRK